MSRGSFKGMSANVYSICGDKGRVLAGKGAILRDFALPGELSTVLETIFNGDF
jgi:hypothetical protein